MKTLQVDLVLSNYLGCNCRRLFRMIHSRTGGQAVAIDYGQDILLREVFVTGLNIRRY